MIAITTSSSIRVNPARSDLRMVGLRSRKGGMEEFPDTGRRFDTPSSGVRVEVDRADGRHAAADPGPPWDRQRKDARDSRRELSDGLRYRRRGKML